MTNMDYIVNNPDKGLPECAEVLGKDLDDLLRDIAAHVTSGRGRGNYEDLLERRYQTLKRTLAGEGQVMISRDMGIALSTTVRDLKVMSPYLERHRGAVNVKNYDRKGKGRSNSKLPEKRTIQGQREIERNAKAYTYIVKVWEHVLEDLRGLGNVSENAKGIEDYVLGAAAANQALCEALGWTEAAEWYEAAQRVAGRTS